VLKCFLLTKRALSDECNTVSPVGFVLRNSVPVLWEVHENAVREVRCMITYDASFQRHGIIREFIKKLNSKIIILERHTYVPQSRYYRNSYLVGPDQRPREYTISKSRSTKH
jgi:hypothetical protein